METTEHRHVCGRRRASQLLSDWAAPTIGSAAPSAFWSRADVRTIGWRLACWSRSRLLTAANRQARLQEATVA